MMPCNTTYKKKCLYLQRRRIRGNAEVRPPNVTATPSASGGECDVKYLLTHFIYHNGEKNKKLFIILPIVSQNKLSYEEFKVNFVQN